LPPTHPELLDDLSVRFMTHNWSLKSLIREIVLSSTYRQSSAVPSIPSPGTPGEGKGEGPAPPAPGIPGEGKGGGPLATSNSQLATTSDPTNDLFSHANRRRLTIEQWRDTVLYVAGDLQESADTKSTELSDPTNLKRTVFARISRKQLNDLLA